MLPCGKKEWKNLSPFLSWMLYKVEFLVFTLEANTISWRWAYHLSRLRYSSHPSHFGKT
jgi:hypothetical protein